MEARLTLQNMQTPFVDEKDEGADHSSNTKRLFKEKSDSKPGHGFAKSLS